MKLDKSKLLLSELVDFKNAPVLHQYKLTVTPKMEKSQFLRHSAVLVDGSGGTHLPSLPYNIVLSLCKLEPRTHKINEKSYRVESVALEDIDWRSDLFEEFLSHLMNSMIEASHTGWKTCKRNYSAISKF